MKNSKAKIIAVIPHHVQWLASVNDINSVIAPPPLGLLVCFSSRAGVEVDQGHLAGKERFLPETPMLLMNYELNGAVDRALSL